jgi:porin
LERQTALTGDWGGLRRTLHDDGIDFTGLYMMESAGNPIGGKHNDGKGSEPIVAS